MTEEARKSKERLLKEYIGFGNSEFVKHLEARLSKAKSELVNCLDATQMRLLQGRAQELESLLSDIKGARAELDKRPKSILVANYY